jgi:PAS domain S-box-containing protein
MLRRETLLSPSQYFVRILLIVFLAESFVMYLMPLVLPEGISRHTVAFLDAGLLTLFCAPVLWVLLIEPLRGVANDQARKYAAVVENAQVGILALDFRGRIESFNRAAEAILGNGGDSLIGKPLTHFLPKFCGETPLVDALEETLQFTAAHRVRKALAIGRGSEPLELEISACAIGSGRGKSFTLILRDISERNRTERELAEAKRKLSEYIQWSEKTLVDASKLHDAQNPIG